MPSMRVRPALAALALYLGLTLWLTWPLGAHLGGLLPDTGPASRFDGILDVWGMAHMSHALVTDPAQLPHGNTFHPAPHAIFYGPPGFGGLPYFAPVFWSTGNPTLASNVQFLLSVVLTAWTLHLVVHRWTGSHLGGFVAGWTLLTTRWVLWDWLPLAPHLAVLQYFPLVIYGAATLAPGVWPALGFGALVALQCLTDGVYVALAVLVPLAVLAMAYLARRRTRARGLGLIVAIGVALVFLLPVEAGHLAVRAANPRLGEQTNWRWDFPAPPVELPWGAISYLLGFFAPTAVPRTVLLLIGVGAVSAVLQRRGDRSSIRQAWAHGAFWAVLGVAMSLPPTGTLHGVSVPLPGMLLAVVLPYVRGVVRFGVAGLMGLAILGGTAAAECAARLPAPNRARPFTFLVRTLSLLAVAGLMYVEYAWVPGFARKPLPASYPLWAPPTLGEPILSVLRRPGGPLLELPVFGVTGPAQARPMYESIFHWRPLVNGYSSYRPAGFKERMVLAANLPNAAALTALRAETGLELVLVHVAELRPDTRAAWQAVALGGREDLRLVAHDGDDLLFQVGEGT